MIATEEELGFSKHSQVYLKIYTGRVPGLPGTRQDEAGLTRKFETSHVKLKEFKKTEDVGRSR